MSGCRHEFIDAQPDKNLRCEDCGVEGEFVPMAELTALRELRDVVISMVEERPPPSLVKIVKRGRLGLIALRAAEGER